MHPDIIFYRRRSSDLPNQSFDDKTVENNSATNHSSAVQEGQNMTPILPLTPAYLSNEPLYITTVRKPSLTGHVSSNDFILPPGFVLSLKSTDFN